MEINIEQFKEFLSVLSEFTWPVVIVIVLFLYRDVVAHFLIAVIDKIFKR